MPELNVGDEVEVAFVGKIMECGSGLADICYRVQYSGDLLETWVFESNLRLRTDSGDGGK